MKYIILLLLCITTILAIQNSFSELDQLECLLYPNCELCRRQSQCGWCAGIQTCLPGTQSGNTPVSGYNFTCIAHDWYYGQCAYCDNYLSCSSCTAIPDCQWCTAGSICKHINSIFGCNPVTSCPCSEHSSCYDCTAGNTCKWCASSGMCFNTTMANGTDCVGNCPCQTFYTCNGCVENPNCIWCADVSAQTCKYKNETCSSPSTSCENYCAQQTSCRNCNARQGCGWCAAKNKCVDTDSDPCQIVVDCPEECLIRLNCDACMNVNSTQKCAWCSDAQGNKCIDTRVQSCLKPVSSKCPHVSSFDGGSFVGGIFFMLGLLLLGVMGVFAYMKVKGKQYAVVS